MAEACARVGVSRSDDRWWRSLAARATIAVGALLVALAALLIADHASELRRTEENVIVHGAVEQARRLSDELASGELTPGGLADQARELGFGYAYLEDAFGAFVAGEAPAAPVPALSPERLGRTLGWPAAVVTTENGVAHAAKRLTLDGRDVTLKFGVPLAPARARARDAVGRGIIAALVFLALALPAFAFAVDRAASPLRALARAAGSPNAAEALMHLAGGRRDEVGALARAQAAVSRALAENVEALHRLTFDDPVTRLPNRASLMSRLVPVLQLDRPAALLEIEVEGLSRIAAGLGQQTGEEAVRRAAARLVAVVEEWSREAQLGEGRAITLARFSDSGFGLFAPGADAAAARMIAGRALAAFDAPLRVDELHVVTTLAIGVALAPDDGEDAAALMRSAAAAVSAARTAGPQSVRFAGAELSRMAYGRLKLEQGLLRAIETGEIELHYQPQIALDDGTASGAEALARWRHPTRGMIPPVEFISVAEECGLIAPLGRMVLAEASRMAADWRDRGMPLRIAVNVSPIEFRRAGFAKQALRIIEAAGAFPSEIEFEITESAAMGDPAHAARELAPLKEAGARIAIDDFGAGYSNLAALTRLPFDVLKVDRAFVRDAEDQEGARAVIRAVVGLARSLGFETVVEGVETERQRDLVKSLGATHAQGYLFGKPMAAGAFEAWFAARRVAELRAVAERARRFDIPGSGAMRA